MELVEVTPTAVERRASVAVVGWKALTAQQARAGRRLHVLAPGERLVIGMDGRFHDGRVLRNADVNGEGCYVVAVGPAVAAAVARRRTGQVPGSPPAPRRQRTTTPDPDVEVIDLLDAILAQDAPRRTVDVLL
ncbi:hypothetical protein [Nocardioides sp.]|uniref:hypothetical protein n=1 Tax=Nocardioides sp. TaxID=35761 RepID=UPI002735E6AF|nr:hypothetical protein [Nocardioides sp.]MDP3894024.1 hypothetical protein [Nocardioides sp.]